MSDRDPLQAAWASQSQEPFAMSVADVHKHATAFQSRIRWRNAIEYVATAFVVCAFAGIAWTVPDPIVRAGAVLTILGALYVCWKLYTLGRAASAAQIDAAANLRDFHRNELIRQRDALKTVWRWYLAPFAPGVLVFLAGVAFAPALEAPLMAKLTVFVTGAAFIAAVFAAIGWLNALAVKRLNTQIAALDQA